MAATKIGTCCYCGAKTVLVLKGRRQHELSCGKCGAPLSKMKMLPSGTGRAAAPVATSARPEPASTSHDRWVSKSSKGKKRKKKKSMAKWVVSELWDVVEDIFD